MAGAQSLIAASALALVAATGVASAAPFTSTGHEAKSQVQRIDYRCWIEDGDEVCGYVAEYDDPDDDDDVYVADDAYAYEPGPPVILGFGIGDGRYHGHGHGPWHR